MSITFEDLKGKILTKVDVSEEKDEILFYTDTEIYKMFHNQECSESVTIEDINGDIKDIMGKPIVLAEESTSYENPRNNEYDDSSFTWTFYKLATIKGYVDIRRYGNSNGFYSEAVDFEKIS
ncbi:hypothetical protein [Clostridium sp.]|uniref:DUF7448 domain-containing protein n=1 Tax=Clostridium sp. TaxID=1506 RepID=UPI002632A94A|nr:hypothetical protein [Clostridium sp.]